MLDSWLDSPFVQMGYDCFLHGTPLVWPAVWQPLLWLGLGAAVSLFWSRRPARAHRVLLLAGAAAVVTPLLSLVVNRMNWGLLHWPSTQTTHVLLAPASPTDADESMGKDAAEFVAANVTRPFHVKTALFPAWLLLSLVCLARLLLGIILGFRLLARATIVHDPALESALAEAAARLGLKKTPALFISSQVRSPVICCWGRRPRLLLPATCITSLSAWEWRGIFMHELAHYKRHDHWNSVLGELLLVLFPWNPLVWRARQRLGFMAERVCDDWALDAGQDAVDYSESLLKLVPQRQSTLALAAVSNKRGLKARIQAILAKRRPKPAVGRTFSAFLTMPAALLVLLVAFAQAPSNIVRPGTHGLPDPVDISGHVVGPNGAPLTDAPVVAMSCPWLYVSNEKLFTRPGFAILGQARTDSHGFFRFSLDRAMLRADAGQLIDRPALKAHVVASAPGHALSWQPIDVETPDPNANITLMLSAEEYYQGRLVDLQGQPAANVRLDVVSVGGHATPFPFWSGDRIDMVSSLVEINRSASKSNGSLDLARRGLIAFWEPPTGLAVWPQAVTTDAQGRFVVHGVGREQEFDLLVRDERFGYQVLRVPAPRPSHGVLVLGAPSVVEGTVVDRETGEPVQGAQVQVDWNVGASPEYDITLEKYVDADYRGRRGSARGTFGGLLSLRHTKTFLRPSPAVLTDATGRFRTQVFVPPGTMVHPLWRNVFFTWVRGPAGRNYLDVVKASIWHSPETVRQTVQVTLPRGVRVRGNVTDEHTGRPVPGARVDCWSKTYKPAGGVVHPGPLKADRDGVFETVLPPATWHLLVNRPTRATKSEFEGLGYPDEVIDIDKLTDLRELLQPNTTRWPIAIVTRDAGHKPRYHPSAWLALEVKVDDKPQQLHVVLP
jgi:beta-lactamase regulating signal transducer with metallopeptidase domain